MSRIAERDGIMEQSFPRVSGDEPLMNVMNVSGDKFSPRERG